MSLLYFIVLPLLASFLMPLYKNYLKYISVILNALLFILAIYFTNLLPITENIAFDSALSISFVLDRASSFFVTLFSFVMLLFSFFNLKNENSKALFILTNMLLVGSFGLVLSHDIFNIYIFFEILSISAYLLTSLNRDKKAYSGAIKYMILGSIASLFLLLAIMVIYLNLGTLNLTKIGENFSNVNENIQLLILLSLFIGFGIKAEIFPLNFWVVDIYQASSSKVASLFSSIVSKAYLFLFFHLVYILHVEPKYLAFLATLGIISFALSELSALSSRDLKRIFAYSTLGQLGVLFLAFSYANVDILSGAIFLIFMHSITKLMLFLSLDILEIHFKSSGVDIFKKFNSLFLTLIFIIGFLSILGIPPFGGFIAKLTILKGLASIQEYFMIFMILLISVVEATYLFRIIGSSLAKTSQEKEKISLPFMQKTVLALLALTIIYFGIFPHELLDICLSVASEMLGVV